MHLSVFKSSLSPVPKVIPVQIEVIPVRIEVIPVPGNELFFVLDLLTPYY